MVSKRIILLLDGTWNDQDVGVTDTNIVRLQAIIAASVADSDSKNRVRATADQKLVRGFTTDGVENIVYYERGVGTGALDRIGGGAFGDGLGLKVRRAYKFLSFHYAPGDSIFIFGFSRGAYTARSLVGYVGAAGLLKLEYCTTEREPIAWNYYRTDPNDRLPGTWRDLGFYTHDRDTLTIDCVAVFDTVGALGIPFSAFSLANRDRFAFHNVELSSITKVNLHAVAIDEHRKPFEAALWRKPKFKTYNTITEQVWFAGAHADIGGGYIPEERRPSEFDQSLDDITLDWLIKRLRTHFDFFPCNLEIWKQINSDWSRASQHEPRQGVYKIFPKAFRAISNYSVADLKSYEVEVSRDRHADPIGEMVHVSAIERLGRPFTTENDDTSYAPSNMISILQRIEATYKPRTDIHNVTEHPVLLVGWDGDPIQPDRQQDEGGALELLANARRRLSGLRPSG